MSCDVFLQMEGFYDILQVFENLWSGDIECGPIGIWGPGELCQR